MFNGAQIDIDPSIHCGEPEAKFVRFGVSFGKVTQGRYQRLKGNGIPKIAAAIRNSGRIRFRVVILRGGEQ